MSEAPWDREVSDALHNAERIRKELPLLIQPSASDRHLVALADEIYRLRKYLGFPT